MAPTPAPTQASGDVQTVAFVSLGCPKNTVDSEKMLGLLAEDGLLPVGSDEDADAIVINTCGFLEASKEESLGEIARAVEAKQAGRTKRVIVAGCLVQRHRAKLLDWCPDVDALIGVFDRDRIVTAVRGTEAGAGTKADVAVELPVYSSIAANATIARQHRGIDASGYFEDDAARLRITPRHYAYLRISEGCNQNCAFCTIPSIRGKMRSKPVERIVSEASELLHDGAFELNLIGQDTTSYGDDIGYQEGLVGMLEALNERVASEGGGWIRLMYAYPSCFTDEMIDAIARLPHVLKYIDMPLQHISDPVLDRMRRRTSRKLIETLLEKLRDRVPGIAIRTTFISGFPGETDEQHQELLEFVDSFGFDAMGVFGYSPEPGTPAGTMHEKGEAVPDEVIAARVAELMEVQQGVAFDAAEAQADAGVELDVLIDEETELALEPDEPEVAAAMADLAVFAGRGYHQAPQVDALTYVQSSEPLAAGELVRCRVIGSAGYDLVAQPVEQLDTAVRLPVVS